MEYAIDSEKVSIAASLAYKNKQYYCPVCKKPVVLRQGELKRHHFAHADSSHDCVNYESRESVTRGTGHVLFRNNVYEDDCTCMQCTLFLVETSYCTRIGCTVNRHGVCKKFKRHGE